jgi:hypothetical protein
VIYLIEYPTNQQIYHLENPSCVQDKLESTGKNIPTPASAPIQNYEYLFFVYWEVGLKKYPSDFLPSLLGINMPKPPPLIPLNGIGGAQDSSFLLQNLL